MSDKIIPLTPALQSAIERVAEQNGFALVQKTMAGRPHANLAEMPDGTFELIEPGSEHPREAKSVKRVWFGPVETNVTSPEVAALAARGAKDPASLTPEEIKAVCASALAQA